MNSPTNFKGEETFWIPIKNRRFKTNTRRHHFAICPYCGKSKKNINLHYRSYHPEILAERLKREFSGEIGSIYGVRFITTTNKLSIK